MTDADEPAHGLMDADEVLALTTRLRDLHDRVDDGATSHAQRRRWQSRLAEISSAASLDLARAVEQLGRLEAEIDRRLGR